MNPFSTPWKQQKTVRFFGSFQEEEKVCIGNKWVIAPTTNVVSELSFLVLKKLKTKVSFLVLKKLKIKMKSIMRNNRLDDLIVLHVYQEKISKIDNCKVANEFIARKDSRKERFSLL